MAFTLAHLSDPHLPPLPAARLRELAILQVGYVSRIAYEYAHHIEIGRGVGVSDEDLRALAIESASTQ